MHVRIRPARGLFQMLHGFPTADSGRRVIYIRMRNAGADFQDNAGADFQRYACDPIRNVLSFQCTYLHIFPGGIPPEPGPQALMLNHCFSVTKTLRRRPTDSLAERG